jgi:hypothetical protein
MLGRLEAARNINEKGVKNERVCWLTHESLSIGRLVISWGRRCKCCCSAAGSNNNSAHSRNSLRLNYGKSGGPGVPPLTFLSRPMSRCTKCPVSAAGAAGRELRGDRGLVSVA